MPHQAKKVYRHGSDHHAMVMCSSKRMFMLCFSSKCKMPRQGGWVEIDEKCLGSEAVRLAVKNQAPIATVEVDGAAEWDRIQARYRGTMEARLTSFGWEQHAASAVTVHAPSYAFMLLGGCRVVVCGSGVVARCPRANPTTANPTTADVLVLEHVESCSGAYSYRLFVRCGCCRAVYVDPWFDVLL